MILKYLAYGSRTNTLTNVAASLIHGQDRILYCLNLIQMYAMHILF